MAFGLELFNSEGVKVLSTSDYTMRRIYREWFPALSLPLQVSRNTSALRSGYVLRTIPGYDPSKCVVMFIPETYKLTPYDGTVRFEAVLPTYVNLGGNVIGIRNYCNVHQNYTGQGIVAYESYGEIAAHWLEVYEYV